MPSQLLMDYQPFELLPDGLASSDVLVVLLEPDASNYSVPSKALAYVCAGRPLLCVMPADNEIARLVTETEAGMVLGPGDPAALSLAVKTPLFDQAARTGWGAPPGPTPRSTSQVDEIAARFEAWLLRRVA